ncbi:hypothetical protein AVEN_159187-1 [Araneus ventricosus]|uniref:Uncharacterized protein n=1 Tax=Araneus ventricosus TaxID=182803 RepID=A0A4Y2Q209_ARAVE|nr:hypothetical protein AVEN_159187-1 [Araneus ventricosus]
MHSMTATLHQIFIEKAKHYSYIVQKSTKPDKNMADIFYKPSSTPVAISQAGEMFLVLVAEEHNLNNRRYAAFLKSSAKIKADLSSIPPTEGAAVQHAFSNVFLFWHLSWYLYQRCTSRRRGGSNLIIY